MCGGGCQFEGGTCFARYDTPLLAYRAGSDLRARSLVETPSGDACLGGTLSMVDLAPSIAGLLGMPVPRHSQGRYIGHVFDHDEAEGYTSDDAYAKVESTIIHNQRKGNYVHKRNC